MKSRVILVVLFFSLVFAVSGAQASQATPPLRVPYEPAVPSLPESIGGYKVLAVFTSDDTACMLPGEKRLILRATQPTVQDYLKDTHYEAIKKDLEQHGLTEMAKWGPQIVGPDTKLEQMLSERQEWNERARNFGCQRFRPPRSRSNGVLIGARPLATGTDGTEIKFVSPSYGYAEFEDTDAGTFTDDNAQSVNLVAPASIAKRPHAVGFLNNVRTDATGLFYLLQNGLAFEDGKGSVIWTDTTRGYIGQTYFGIPYVASDTYWATITFTSGVWQMCALDIAVPPTYTCILESSAQGTTLAPDVSTAVWVENQNASPNWFNGFSSPLQAWGAQIYRNGTGQNWASQHRHTLDSCRTNWDPNNALAGTLVAGLTGYFYLNGVPLSC